MTLVTYIRDQKQNPDMGRFIYPVLWFQGPMLASLRNGNQCRMGGGRVLRVGQQEAHLRVLCLAISSRIVLFSKRRGII